MMKFKFLLATVLFLTSQAVGPMTPTVAMGGTLTLNSDQLNQIRLHAWLSGYNEAIGPTDPQFDTDLRQQPLFINVAPATKSMFALGLAYDLTLLGYTVTWTSDKTGNLTFVGAKSNVPGPPGQ